YTSRMLGYLTVAQFDGLISAWHYKYQYNRLAPYQNDNSIESAYSKTMLPSYPSDGAVIAVASRNILSARFPLGKKVLEEKGAEHLSSLKWSGSNVASDLAAGEVIGAEVAKVALARASTDGMSKAQTPRPISDSIMNAAKERFGWYWENKEIPKRPVGLAPLYGKVKMWSVPNVELVRP